MLSFVSLNVCKAHPGRYLEWAGSRGYTVVCYQEVLEPLGFGQAMGWSEFANTNGQSAGVSIFVRVLFDMLVKNVQ